jgi:hypothetical protein
MMAVLLLLDFVARRQDFYRGALSHGCFCSTYSLRSTAYSLRGRPIWLRPAGRAMQDIPQSAIRNRLRAGPALKERR